MSKFEEPIISLVKFNEEEHIYTVSFNDIKKPYETDPMPLNEEDGPAM